MNSNGVNIVRSVGQFCPRGFDFRTWTFHSITGSQIYTYNEHTTTCSFLDLVHQAVDFWKLRKEENVSTVWIAGNFIEFHLINISDPDRK